MFAKENCRRHTMRAGHARSRYLNPKMGMPQSTSMHGVIIQKILNWEFAIEFISSFFKKTVNFVILINGACGYGDLNKQGYGLETTALSSALFNDGLACGACHALICVDDPKGCLPNAGAVLVTATNFWPPNYSKPQEETNNSCNPPSKHFKLSLPMYARIADEKTPKVPVIYRRVPGAKAGGVKFQIVKGDSSVMRVLLYNVAGAGDVSNVKIKGSTSSGWLQMRRIQGQTWQIGNTLQGQSLSFLVTTSDGKMVEFDNLCQKIGDLVKPIRD